MGAEGWIDQSGVFQNYLPQCLVIFVKGLFVPVGTSLNVFHTDSVLRLKKKLLKELTKPGTFDSKRDAKTMVLKLNGNPLKDDAIADQINGIEDQSTIDHNHWVWIKKGQSTPAPRRRLTNQRLID